MKSLYLLLSLDVLFCSPWIQKWNHLRSFPVMAMTDIAQSGIGKIEGPDGSKPSIFTKRRIRYSGKYPKKFGDKYKEARGDAEIVEKVMSKGGTPAGTHVPIMLQECLEHMNISNSRVLMKTICVDCTVGYGGHTTEIVKKILPTDGSLYAIDQDRLEINRTEYRLRMFLNNSLSDMSKLQTAQSSIHFIHSNFRDIEKNLNLHNLTGKVDCVLADLGFSSMQIDNPERGFTYKYDGPLDMRMDPTSALTAAEYLELVDEDELSSTLHENSDEVHAGAIAKEIKSFPIPRTTLQLAERVRKCYLSTLASQGRAPSRDTINPAIARTMQAIRIAVNGEFEALEALLEALPRVLAPGGRAVILTFHSGEDRRVKRAFKGGVATGVYSAWSRDVVRPSFEEQRMNPRSKCAKLR